MPLQIRRGTTAQRLAITPLTGELIYDTTTGQIFVGNGTTVGGATTTGISTEDAQDAAASLFTSGSHSGITFAYNDAAGRIDATVTVAATGPFDGDLTGSVFSDNSTLLVDGTGAKIVGDIDTTQFNLLGSSVVETPLGKKWIVETDVYQGSSANDWAFFRQAHSNVDANSLAFLRSRGTIIAPTGVVNGDKLMALTVLGYDGNNYRSAASIEASVEGVVSSSNVSTKLVFKTRNGSSFATRAEISSTGILKTNSIGAFSGTTISVVDNNTITLGDVRLSQDGLSTINTNASLILSANGTGSVDIESVRIVGSAITASSGTLTLTGNVVGNLDGDITGSVFTDNSTRVIDGTDGRITATSVTISNTGYLQLPVYADDTARLAAIPTPVKGMMVFMTTGTVPTATNNAVIYNGTTWVNV
jgi:hypothetical protein